MREKDIEILMKSLPNFLKHDIEEVEKNKDNEDCNVYDCLLDEVYGSINSVYWDNLVSEDEANYLREKYYFGNQKYLKKEERKKLKEDKDAGNN